MNRTLRSLSFAALLAGASLCLPAQENKEKEKPKRGREPHSAPAQTAPQKHETAPPAHTPAPAPAAAPANKSEGGRRFGTRPNETQHPPAAAPAATPETHTPNPPANPENGRRFGSRPNDPQRAPAVDTPSPRPNNTPSPAAGGFPNSRTNDRPGGPPRDARPVDRGGFGASGDARPVDRGGFGVSGNARPAGPVVTRTPNGSFVRRAPDGSVREVRTSTGTIVRTAPSGTRYVEVARPGNRVVVARSYGGYVQRPIVYGGGAYVQRTYIVSGRPVVRVYHPYVWGGTTVAIYRPVRYYPAPYYTWAYTPWSRPVRWGWGWGVSTPWYGYYGGWFTPYPVYSSPAMWLTDFMVAATLEEAYRDRMAAHAEMAAANNYGQTPLTPDVKQAISDEVRRQLDQERAEQQNANYQPSLFGGSGEHVFVVANALEVGSNTGQCVLTEGDVLQLQGAPPQGAESAQVTVLASKGADCRKGATASVAVVELQEMQNHMRATLDRGLDELRSKQGQGDIPALPPAAAAPVTQAAYAADIQADPAAANEIAQAAQEGDRAGQEAVSQGAAGSAPSINIALGQTVDEVIAALGRPPKTANLGAKQIFIYNDMKITFQDGRVTDVQ